MAEGETDIVQDLDTQDAGRESAQPDGVAKGEETSSAKGKPDRAFAEMRAANEKLTAEVAKIRGEYNILIGAIEADPDTGALLLGRMSKEEFVEKLTAGGRKAQASLRELIKKNPEEGWGAALDTIERLETRLAETEKRAVQAHEVSAAQRQRTQEDTMRAWQQDALDRRGVDVDEGVFDDVLLLGQREFLRLRPNFRDSDDVKEKSEKALDAVLKRLGLKTASNGQDADELPVRRPRRSGAPPSAGGGGVDIKLGDTNLREIGRDDAKRRALLAKLVERGVL